MSGILTVVILLLVGFIFGRMNERNHLARLLKDEAEYADILTVNLKTIDANDFTPGGVLVSGNVVVAVDYFKVIVAQLKTLIGGRLRSYETLIDRARREAIIRMKREARALGANAVYNVRLEYSNIGQQPGRAGGVELLAYGTALKAHHDQHPQT